MPLICCAMHAVMCILQHNLGADICPLKQQDILQYWSDCMCCSTHLLPRHSDTAVLPFGILHVPFDMHDGPWSMSQLPFSVSTSPAGYKQGAGH